MKNQSLNQSTNQKQNTESGDVGGGAFTEEDANKKKKIKEQGVTFKLNNFFCTRMLSYKSEFAFWNSLHLNLLFIENGNQAGSRYG